MYLILDKSPQYLQELVEPSEDNHVTFDDDDGHRYLLELEDPEGLVAFFEDQMYLGYELRTDGETHYWIELNEEAMD